MLAPGKAFAAFLALGAVAVTAATGVAAHPHVLVDAKAEIVFDNHQRIAAVRNVWRFDAAFSAFALQGLDKDGNGRFSDAELAPLAQENVESLAGYDYFTYLVAKGRKHAFKPAEQYWLEYHGDQLTLNFTLPLDEPVAADGTVKLEIFDPEYFVAITLVDDHAVSLDGAPPSCKATYQPPHELDANTMAALAAIPIGEHDLPPDLLDAASALSNQIRVSCPGLVIATAEVPPGPTMPRAAATDSVASAPGRPRSDDTAVQPATAMLEGSATRLSVPQPSAGTPAEAVANAAAEPSPAASQARAESAVTKSLLSPAAFFAILVILVAGIAVCAVLLVGRLRGAR